MAEWAVSCPQLGCCGWRGKKRGLRLLFSQWNLVESVCLSRGQASSQTRSWPQPRWPVHLAAEEKLCCVEKHFETAVPWHSFWWTAKHSKQRPSHITKLRQTKQMQMQFNIHCYSLSVVTLAGLSSVERSHHLKSSIIDWKSDFFFCFFLTMQFKGHLIDINTSIKEVFYEYNIWIQGHSTEKISCYLMLIYLFLCTVNTGHSFNGAAVTRYWQTWLTWLFWSVLT